MSNILSRISNAENVELNKIKPKSIHDALIEHDRIKRKYVKIRSLAKTHLMRNWLLVKAGNTGVHCPSNIVTLINNTYPEAYFKSYSIDEILSVISTMHKTSIPLGIKEYILKHIHKARLVTTSQFETASVWKYIYSRLEDNEVEEAICNRYCAKSKGELFSTFKKAHPFNKNIVYEYFTTNKYIGYTEKRKLLLNSINSTKFSNDELNAMLMHNNNFRALICILSENRLSKSLMSENLSILRSILTPSNYSTVLLDIRNMKHYS